MTEKPKKTAKVVPLRNRGCPTCGAPAAAEFKPFCSKRCADVDLGRWFNEGYRIPTDEAPGERDMEAEMAAGLDDNGADEG